MDDGQLFFLRDWALTCIALACTLAGIVSAVFAIVFYVLGQIPPTIVLAIFAAIALLIGACIWRSLKLR